MNPIARALFDPVVRFLVVPGLTPAPVRFAALRAVSWVLCWFL